MEETESSSSRERPFTRSQSRLGRRLSMVTPSGSDKGVSKKEIAPSKDTKPKPPRLRSQLPPITRSTSTAAKSHQRNETTVPVLTYLPKPSQKPSAETTKKDVSVQMTNSNRPTHQPPTGKSQTESVTRPESQSVLKIRSARALPRPAPATRRTRNSKPVGQGNTHDQKENQQVSTDRKSPISIPSGMENAPASSSAAVQKVSKSLVQAGRATNWSLQNVLAEAKAAKERKANNPLAQNIVERTRGKMLPLPIGDLTPPRNMRAVRRQRNAPVRKVTRKSPRQKPPARKTAANMMPREKKPQPATRARTKIQLSQNTISGRSPRPIAQKRRIPQTRPGSTRATPSRQPRMRSRRGVSNSSDEYDLEILQARFQRQQPPSTRSKPPSTRSEAPLTHSRHAEESDSDSEASPYANIALEKGSSTSSDEKSSESFARGDSSKSASESESCDDSSKTGTSPGRGGKTVPKYILRQISLPDLHAAGGSAERTQKVPTRNGTHKLVAQKSAARKSIAAKTPALEAAGHKSVANKTVARKGVANKTAASKTVASKIVAGKSVASKTVAGKTVAGKTVAGKTVAGKTVAGKTVAGKTVAGKTVAGKTVAGKTVAGKTVAGKTVAGKTVAGKTVAGKTVAGKTVAGKTLRQMTLPNRRIHAGGIRRDSGPSLTQTSDQSKEKVPDSSSDTNSDERDTDSEERYSSASSDSESESYTDDSDDLSESSVEKEFQRTKSQRGKRGKIIGTDYEALRKETRDRCSEQLLKQNKEQYSSSVREEFFLEMQYILHLIRKLKNEESARDRLTDSMSYFEKEIAPLRMDGLKSLGCQVEALNYSCWVQFFHARRRVLQETADPAWKENFASVREVLESASKSARPGKKVTIELDDARLKFLLNNWKVLRNTLDVLALFSSELCKIQTEEGGCQLQ